MAKDYWELTRIEATINAQKLHDFTAYLDGPVGALRVPISADALLDYFQFQREVLWHGGVMYRYPVSEGRDPSSANFYWKMLVQGFVEQNQNRVPPPEQGEAMMN